MSTFNSASWTTLLTKVMQQMRDEPYFVFPTSVGVNHAYAIICYHTKGLPHERGGEP